MRKISATYIISCNLPPLKNGILVCNDDGSIADIIDTGGTLHEQAGLEQYSGILVPGFINAHCHLELSHLTGKIEPEEYLNEINRPGSNETIPDDTAFFKADFQMKQAGIVAAGDISHSTRTLEVKRKSRLYYHTFAEAFSFQPSRAEKAFRAAQHIENTFKINGMAASVTPHSCCSVSGRLLEKISEHSQFTGGILSVHNQDSGYLSHPLHPNPGFNITHRHEEAEKRLMSAISVLPAKNHLLLINNTFTTPETIETIKKCRDLSNTFFVLCPKSNLLIEGQLPPVELFRKVSLNICLGTGLLSLNQQFSVLEEMITLQQYFPELKIEEMAEWACLNGAQALCIESRYGSFEKGKKPGINLITGVDLQQRKLTTTSRIKVLL